MATATRSTLTPAQYAEFVELIKTQTANERRHGQLVGITSGIAIGVAIPVIVALLGLAWGWFTHGGIITALGGAPIEYYDHPTDKDRRYACITFEKKEMQLCLTDLWDNVEGGLSLYNTNGILKRKY